MVLGVSPRHRGFFLILFGSKNVVGDDPAAAPPPGDAKCPRCGQAGRLSAKRVRRWFTAFFVPVFPIGPARRFTQCGHCGATFAASTAQVAEGVARADAKQVQRGIALYNSLRASPANSVTLNELLTLYGSIGEAGQAISAAAEFPAALDASEQCMVTLGRIHAQAGDTAAAVRWFDAAVARNPDLGEAYYQRATAYLNAVPPDLDRAVASARSARRVDYPGAADLARDLEARVRGE